MVIADMLIENRTLSSLVLDDNPVGKRGGRAILRALRSIVLFKMERQISLRHCNFDYQVGSPCPCDRTTVAFLSNKLCPTSLSLSGTQSSEFDTKHPLHSRVLLFVRHTV